MGLPNYRNESSVTTPKKSPARSRTKDGRGDCKPRSWRDLDTATRAGTNYAKEEGWMPLFHGLLADLCRLSSGNTCTLLALLIFQDLGRQRSKLTDWRLPEETRALLVPELASLVGVDERSINRELAYMAARGMAVVARLAGGRVVVRLLFASWPGIEQSYKTWALEQAKQAAASPGEGAAAPLEPGEVVRVKGGHRSRSIPLGCEVRSLRIHLSDKTIDLEFHPVVESGELVLTAWRPVAETLESKQGANGSKQKGSEFESGHICPPVSRSPARGGVGAGTVSHVRADELAQLFDPLLFRHLEKTLSGDSRSWLKSCEVIADTPHDVLVKAAIERASRPIRRTSDVIAICREIEHNWSISGDLPAVSIPKSSTDTSRAKGDARARQVIHGLKLLERMRQRRVERQKNNGTS